MQACRTDESFSVAMLPSTLTLYQFKKGDISNRSFFGMRMLSSIAKVSTSDFQELYVAVLTAGV